MKYLLIAFVTFTALFAIAFADCDLGGHKFNAGETYSPDGECLKYTCQEGGGLSAVGCPSAPVPPNCKAIPTDKSKPYPSCCAHHEC